MTPKVLISDSLSPAAVQIFKDRGIAVEFQPKLGADKDKLAELVGDYDGLAIRSATKVTPKILEQAKKLKVIGRAGIGVDNVDIPAATARGIVVMNTPFGNSITTAEHAIALMFALLINASILILAAATFNSRGQTDVTELEQVHSFLTPMLGSVYAPTLFAIALLCCGLNSTVTATLSGQIVMEGFINLRLPAWARRLATRSIAIIPAAIAIALYGASGTGKLLIMSQVVLSMQLPFAIVPLVLFTADRHKMGELVAPLWVTALAVVVAVVVVTLNAKIIFDLAVA